MLYIYTQVEKKKDTKTGSKSRVPANSVAQKKSRHSNKFCYSECTLDRQVKGKNVIQRLVNTQNFDKSENGNYIIDGNNRSNLYSLTTAPDPVPKRLYTRTEDEDERGRTLNCWKPNVRLFSDEENSQIKSTRTKTVPSDALFGLAGCLGFKKEIFDHDLENSMINELQSNINDSNNDLVGIIGKNDCGEFAKYLQSLIGAGDDRPEYEDDREDVLETRIGDKMKYVFKSQSGCPYHYATIVAADGKSKVTLEANAGVSLTEPEFHIRNGIQGFIDDNNEGEEKKVSIEEKNFYEIARLESKSKDEYKDSLANSALNIKDPDKEQEYRTKGGRKITDTVAGITKD